MHPAVICSLVGVTGLFLLLLIRKRRLQKSTETGAAAPEVAQQIAAQLGAYLGTSRKPGWTDGKDPIQYGEHVYRILGQRSWASQELQEFVREHIAAGEFPEDVGSEAEMNEHANRAEYIRRFCVAMQQPQQRK